MKISISMASGPGPHLDMEQLMALGPGPHLDMELMMALGPGPHLAMNRRRSRASSLVSATPGLTLRASTWLSAAV